MSILYLYRNSVDDSYVYSAANLLGCAKNGSSDTDLICRDRSDDADTETKRVSQGSIIRMGKEALTLKSCMRQRSLR